MEQRVVYSKECGDCDAIYIGQTGRKLSKRCSEHKYHICSNIYKHRIPYKNELAGQQQKVTPKKILEKCFKDNAQISKNMVKYDKRKIAKREPRKLK